MINKENMRAWVAALRSGQFRQGEGKLTRIAKDGSTTHCCLGVVCEIAGVPRTRTMHDGEGEYVFYRETRYGNLDEPSYLPQSGAEWLGLVGTEDGDTSNPRARGAAGDFVPLAYANDALKWDFLQIADAIERTYDLTTP